jgi:acetylornithine deacetylase
VPSVSSDPVQILRQLIAFDTQNPTGDEHAICRHLASALSALGALAVDLREVPRATGRRAFVYARFGAEKPALLINAHVDTVPANTGWSCNPFGGELRDDRVYGLGACDTKAAIASILAALAAAGGNLRPVGILFSGDEELGTRCAQSFLASDLAAGIERAIVCEPSRRRAGIAHRGIWSRTAHIKGRGGHSSRADEMPKPILACARLAVAIDAIGAGYRERGPAGMTGLCTNIAGIAGGVAFNVVPDDATLTWSIRPYPGFDPAEYDRMLADAVAATGETFEITSMLDHAPFACREPERFAEMLGPDVPLETLDFWTEAALFARAGIDAVVVGPGDIGNAHAPDEYVDIADLAWGVDMFGRLVST